MSNVEPANQTDCHRHLLITEISIITHLKSICLTSLLAATTLTWRPVFNRCSSSWLEGEQNDSCFKPLLKKHSHNVHFQYFTNILWVTLKCWQWFCHNPQQFLLRRNRYLGPCLIHILRLQFNISQYFPVYSIHPSLNLIQDCLLETTSPIS